MTILSIGFIVFLAVTHKIIEGKTIMTGYEIDAIEWFLAGVLIQICTAAQAAGQGIGVAEVCLQQIVDSR